MARPLKEINWDLVEKMIEAECSANEISAKFRINHDTFYKRFKDEYKVSFQDYQAVFHSAGRGDLKLMQHMKALNNDASGNIQMLMYLGKVRLGQVESIVNLIPKNDEEIGKDQKIMQLENQLKEALSNNDNKSKTE